MKQCYLFWLYYLLEDIISEPKEFVDKFLLMLAGELYTSEKEGSDEQGDGTQEKPFKTLLKV